MPSRSTRRLPALAIAETLLGEMLGQAQALRVAMGATIPIGAVFQEHLGAGTIFFSFSTSDEDYHAPNEFFRLQRLDDGLKAWVRYWELLGERRADELFQSVLAITTSRAGDRHAQRDAFFLDRRAGRAYRLARFRRSRWSADLLDRIAELDPALNSFITVWRRRAWRRRRARSASLRAGAIAVRCTACRWRSRT